AEPPDVGEVAADLRRDQEARRRPVPPPLERGVGGKPVEGVVDLNGREPLRVERQPPALRQVARVEAGLPGVVLPAARADPERRPPPPSLCRVPPPDSSPRRQPPGITGLVAGDFVPPA